MNKETLTKTQELLKRLGALALSGVLLITPLSACGKKMDCSYKGEHAHKYVNDEGFITYQNSDYEFEEGFGWTSEVVDYTDEMKLLDDHNLLKIEDNKELLEKLISQNNLFIEYEYEYMWMMPIPHYSFNGKTTTVYYTYISMWDEDFTTDPNHSDLTGRIRESDYKYYGYKIITDEKGKPKIVRSELVDNLFDIAGEYPYFSLGDYVQIIHGEPYNTFNQKLQ